MPLAAGEVHDGRIYRHENILVARETITGQIYMSFAAEVQIECAVGVDFSRHAKGSE